MKKKKRTRSSGSTKSLFFVLAAFVVILFVVVFSFFYWNFKDYQALKPLSQLHVPEAPKLIFPGTYESPQKESNVLGSEPIEPRDIITYINEERMKRGARPLRVSETLMKAAKMRAETIMKHQNFSHHDPYDGIQLDTVLPLLSYPFSWASENIGMGDSTARAFVSGFMNSPSHRANLLNPDLVETGVAVATGPYKQYYVNLAVQLFAIPVDRTTFLGYTEKDVEEYRALLTKIGKQLEITKKLKEKNPEDAQYYEDWQQILIRQQEIIATLSYTMGQDKPLSKELIAMIREYNSNWASVPLKE